MYDKATNKFIAFVWQTLAMRANLFHYGSSLSLDFMMCTTNHYLWPYGSVALRTETMKFCLGCESFGCAESDAGYVSLLPPCMTCHLTRIHHIAKLF
jgi:hypothetical protein